MKTYDKTMKSFGVELSLEESDKVKIDLYSGVVARDIENHVGIIETVENGIYKGKNPDTGESWQSSQPVVVFNSIEEYRASMIENNQGAD